MFRVTVEGEVKEWTDFVWVIYDVQRRANVASATEPTKPFTIEYTDDE
jgi:hypothetical protein